MTALQNKLLLEVHDQMSCDQTKDTTTVFSSATSTCGLDVKSIDVEGTESEHRSGDSGLSSTNHSEKHERIVNLFNQQIHLIQTSSESMIQKLRSEISSMMNDDDRTPQLLERTKIADMGSPVSELTLLSLSMDDPTTSEASQHRPTIESNEPLALSMQEKSFRNNVGIKSNKFVDEELIRSREENKRLQLRYRQFGNYMNFDQNQTRQRGIQINDKKLAITEEIRQCKSNGNCGATTSTVDLKKHRWLDWQRSEISALLDRVEVVWDKVDKSIQKTSEGSTTGMGITGDAIHSSFHSQRPVDEVRILSVQKASCEVHDQVKISLMLIELKIRNTLHLLESEASMENVHVVVLNDELRQQLDSIQDTAMSAYKDVEQRTNEQIRNLKEQSIRESRKLRDMYTIDMTNLQELSQRQERLASEVTRFNQSMNSTDTPGTQLNTGMLVVDQATLLQLNSEVDRVVEQIKVLNQSNNQLRIEIDEYKMRERTLTKELNQFARERTEKNGTSNHSILGVHSASEHSTELEEKMQYDNKI